MPRRLAVPMLAVLLLALLAAAVARGVIVGPGSGAGSDAAPADDPGFAHVGQRGELTAIYLGRGWMLTAAHVGPGDVILAGVSYPYLQGSHVLLARPAPEAPPPDLALFRVDPSPDLPPLAIRSRAPAVGDVVVLVGFGRDRGEAIRWHGIRGFAWAPNHAMRWGTNQVHATGIDLAAAGLRTRAFSTQFNAFGTPHEAQAAHGDSGGAAFLRGPGGWELAGVLLSVTLYDGQPNAALYGNQTLVADLSAYRAEILARTAAAAAAARGAPGRAVPAVRALPAPSGDAPAASSRGDRAPAGDREKLPTR